MGHGGARGAEAASEGTPRAARAAPVAAAVEVTPLEGAPAPSTPVWIEADDALLRDGIAARLGAAAEIALAATQADAAIVLWVSERPDGGPPAGGADLPWVALVRDAEAAARALARGAAGAFDRAASVAVWAAVLQAAARGAIAVDPATARALVRDRAPGAAAGEAPELTPREMEVLELVAAGHSNRRIARRLGISEHTAKFHVNAILEKLDADTRTHAVVTAARLGLLLL